MGSPRSVSTMNGVGRASAILSLLEALHEARCPLPRLLQSSTASVRELIDRFTGYFGLPSSDSLTFTPSCASPSTSPHTTLSSLLDFLSRPPSPHLSGSFYTPPDLAMCLLERVLGEFQARHGRLPSHLLDPACGSGAFTIAGLQLLTKSGMQPLEALQAIHGWDLEPNAIVCARLGGYAAYLTLLGTAPEILPALSGNYCCRDTLQDEIGSEMQQFDLIVGNPPFGLSREGRIPKEALRVLSKRYDHIRTGKLNKYVLFVARSLELLGPNGMLSLIIPNSWLGIDSGRGLRNLMRSCCNHIVIDRFLAPLFPALGVESVVLTLCKGGHSSRYLVRTFASPLDKNPLHSQWYNLSQRSADDAWPITGNNAAHDWLHDIEANAKPLDSLTRCYVGLQAYANGKGTPPQSAPQVLSHPFHSDRPFREHSMPYLQGKDIRRYSVRWSGSHIHYGEWLAEHPPRHRYEGSRILIREVLHKPPQRVQACCTSESFVHNRSGLVLHSCPNGEHRLLLALCALLNSEIGSLIISLRGRKSQRMLFPKLVQDDLKRFPISKDFTQAITELARASELLHQSEGEDEHAEATAEQLLRDLYKFPSHGDIATLLI